MPRPSNADVEESALELVNEVEQRLKESSFASLRNIYSGDDSIKARQTFGFDRVFGRTKDQRLESRRSSSAAVQIRPREFKKWQQIFSRTAFSGSKCLFIDIHLVILMA